ncbi:MAG: class I SAM-dependent methyltransferase [Ectothiorhodospiraceae bacterium]|nr:class I SAM-dependent methyltransferase [Ectothiorhodospiraceae bacterium]
MSTSAKKDKMNSKELGLVLGQQILGVNDLHYGLWEHDIPLSFANVAEAQQRYTDRIIDALPSANGGGTGGGTKVIDIGCGTGHILGQLLDRGFVADGLVPAPKLAEQVRKRLAERSSKPARLFEATFEQFPVDEYREGYDAALFSESYQYIPMAASFPILAKIIKPGGVIVICDFFKTEHAGDGQPGDKSFGGGHKMSTFYEELEKHPFSLVQDEDITHLVSPNIKLLDEALMLKIVPAGKTLNRFLTENYPRTWGIIKAIFKLFLGKKIEKQKYKYFTGNRTQAVFERYKTYRLLVLKRDS